MNRTALDSSGGVGSLYNAYQDSVAERINMSGDKRSFQLNKTIQCEIINGDSDKSRNLLKMVGIQADVRLSILLELVPKTGIATLIEYTHPIDKNTRFLYFSDVGREHRIRDTAVEAQKDVNTSLPQTNATHIITAVTFGIDIVIALQLPDDTAMVRQIDGVLKEVQQILKGSKNVSALTTDDKNLLKEIIKTKTYSNVSALNEMASILNVCQYMNTCSTGSRIDRPLTYTIQPIQWLHPKYDGPGTAYFQVEESVSERVEQRFLELSNSVKRLKHSLNDDMTTLHSKHLETQLEKAQDQWQSLNQAYDDETKRFQKLIVAIRSTQKDVSQIYQALDGKEQSILNDNIQKLNQEVNDLKGKGKLITTLQKEHFGYYNVAHYNTDSADNEHIAKHKLVTEEKYDQILCSTDFFNKQDPSKWEKLCCRLTDEHRKNPCLRILYADFSYCPYELQDMVILPSNLKNKDEKLTDKKALAPSTLRKASSIPLSQSSDDEIINILLLGESGVGKSTFINAFANYLSFRTLNEAEESKPVVLIPVSFMMTTGQNFDERIVKFGDVDSCINEDFHQPGQSVTQHCRTYVFHLNHHDGRKLRIIDTPGFGDTRGLDQDDLNMQHILEYINNLTHLNAVCFLLKPNTSQLSPYFQICLTQLIDLLGPAGRQNITFCFTNARSTFYTPGDTAPLLKDLLRSLSMDDIPFKRDNTFCFDSESFRYFVALQNGIQFNDEERHEYEMSWSTSVKESNRLIDYICAQISDCRMDGKWHSNKHAQLQIIPMIRPMLEAMRNILRNGILWKMDSLNKSIELIAKALRRPAAVCSTCSGDPIQRGKFWIARDVPHKIEKKCSSCSCAPNQHITINYELEYEYLNRSPNSNRAEMKEKLNLLQHASNEFAHFLMHVAHAARGDPFWIGIAQMIREENNLCKSQKPNEMNLKLVENLQKLMTRYEGRADAMKPNQEHSELSIIYDWIQTIREYPEVREQMKAVKQTQSMTMLQCEYEMLKDSTNTLAHSTTSS